MKLSFDYKGINVTYYLTYRKAKAISIQVTENGTVNVVAPIGTSVFSVMDKVKGNAPWIISEVYGKSNKQIEPKLLEQYMYLGKNYKLDLNITDQVEGTKVKLSRGKLMVESSTDQTSIIRQAIIDWYQAKVATKMKERLKEYSEHFEIVPTAIEEVKDEHILFKFNGEAFEVNARVGILSIDIINYMIVNALCHINYKEEEKVLAQLEALLPSYKKSQEWLSENKNKLKL